MSDVDKEHVDTVVRKHLLSVHSNVLNSIENDATRKGVEHALVEAYQAGQAAKQADIYRKQTQETRDFLEATSKIDGVSTVIVR